MIRFILPLILLIGFSNLTNGEISPANETIKEIVYKKTSEAELKLWIHLPPEWNKEKQFPAIIFFFGGGWVGGKIDQFTPQATYFAQRGLVTIRADYRVKNRHGTTPQSCVEDAKSAMRWLRRHAAEYAIDPDKIIASGGSAGGHLAISTFTLSGFDSKTDNLSISCKPNLLVLYNPVLSLPWIAQRVESEKTARQLTPNENLTNDLPPAILFFGTEDKFIEDAHEFMDKAKKLGLSASLYTAQGAKHGFFNREPYLSRTTLLADQFLIKHGYLQGETTIKAEDGEMTLADSN